MASLYVEDELTDEGELGPVNVCLFPISQYFLKNLKDFF